MSSTTLRQKFLSTIVMTKVSTIVVVLALLVGYFLGNFFPLQNFSTDKGAVSDKTTSVSNGKGVLEVLVSNSDGEPMVGIEIDVAVQSGPPESWGVKEADTSGKADFELAPGDYYVYFNTGRFPLGYATPVPQQIRVEEGQTQTVTIVLEKN